MKQLIVILASFLLSTCLLAQQEVKFKAVVGGDKVSLYETIDIRFQIEGAKFNEFKLPDFEGFEIVGGPNQSTSIQYVNGKMSQQAAYSYKLRAIKEGTLVISPATVIVDGNILETEQLEIEVVKDGNIKPPPPPATRFDSPFFRTEPPTRKKNNKKKRSTITI